MPLRRDSLDHASAAERPDEARLPGAPLPARPLGRLAAPWAFAAWPSRQAALTVLLLTAAFWVAVAIVFVAGAVHEAKHVPMALLGHGILAVTGALLCAPLYKASVWPSQFATVRRGILLGLMVLVAAGIQGWLDLHVFAEIQNRTLPDSTPPPSLHVWRFNVMIYVWIYAFYTTIIAMMLALLKAQRSERQSLQAHAAADRARLEALRLQINPHFLFNALNAATSLVNLGRNTEAEKVLLRLSDFFRSSLTSHAGDMVTLATEFDDLSAYLDIESVRFGRRLRVAMDLPEALQSASVPHFLFQPLVENAVKHGVAKSTERTTISVLAMAVDQRLIVRIENDDALIPVQTPTGNEVGLLNVRKRLQVLYGDNAFLETGRHGGRFWCQVDLPLNGQAVSTAPPTRAA